MHTIWPLSKQRKHCRTPRGTGAPRRIGLRCRQGLRHHSASATEPEPPEDSKPVSCPLKCPSRSSVPPSVIGRETEAGRAHGFIPFRLHPKKSKAVSPPHTHTLGPHGTTGKMGRGSKAIKVREAGQHCHTQDGGTAAARSLRGGTDACAARSPGPGHKMAAAALGRARRRRQNGRSSRTCSRIPSSPLRAAADARSSLSPCQLHC